MESPWSWASEQEYMILWPYWDYLALGLQVYTYRDSIKLEHGPGFSFFSRLWDWRTVIFQLWGFYCNAYVGVQSVYL